MAKNVALSDKAYKSLSNLKTGNESFSDVIMRMTGGKEKKNVWRNYIGAFEGDKEMEEIYKKILSDRHKTPARGVRL
ncbi:MAG: antitoxin VapB family protein [archaeon]|nr:antitoxin VapB family protein [archaeon]